jgi:hypothetical protein
MVVVGNGNMILRYEYTIETLEMLGRDDNWWTDEFMSSFMTLLKTTCEHKKND